MIAHMNKKEKNISPLTILDKYKIEGINIDFGYYISNITRIPYINKKGLILVKEIKLYNFVTLDNELVFDNWLSSIDYYDSSKDLLIFSTIVNDDNVYGAFNRNGKLVAYPIYDSIEFLKKDTNYMICKMNNIVISCDKDGIQIPLEHYECNNEKVKVKK